MLRIPSLSMKGCGPPDVVIDVIRKAADRLNATDPAKEPLSDNDDQGQF
jgi:hypothetical protein